MTIFFRTSASFLCIFLASCAAKPLSEQLARRPIPPAVTLQEDNGAEITFSAERKYETPAGVPLAGDPLVCSEGKVGRVNGVNPDANRITVKPSQEIAVTSVIAWENTGFRKVCGPFVAFTPEPGMKYAVVNERIGGKGMSALWTGMARQTCQVSVYRVAPNGFARVPTRPVRSGECLVAEP